MLCNTAADEHKESKALLQDLQGLEFTHDLENTSSPLDLNGLSLKGSVNQDLLGQQQDDLLGNQTSQQNYFTSPNEQPVLLPIEASTSNSNNYSQDMLCDNSVLNQQTSVAIQLSAENQRLSAPTLKPVESQQVSGLQSQQLGSQNLGSLYSQATLLEAQQPIIPTLAKSENQLTDTHQPHNQQYMADCQQTAESPSQQKLYNTQQPVIEARHYHQTLQSPINSTTSTASNQQYTSTGGTTVDKQYTSTGGTAVDKQYTSTGGTAVDKQFISTNIPVSEEASAPAEDPIDVDWNDFTS